MRYNKQDKIRRYNKHDKIRSDQIRTCVHPLTYLTNIVNNSDHQWTIKARTWVQWNPSIVVPRRRANLWIKA